MSENLTSKNIENGDCTENTEESDFENLIIRLKEISKTIDLLKKTIFK